MGARRRIGVDTGGTFTDFVRIDDGALRVFKVPSTPRSPDRAILDGLTKQEAGEPDDIVHGSTVATNALLERKGARTALVTTSGFEDILAIGRQTRPDLYRIFTTRAEPLVPARLRVGLKQRILPGGEIEVPIDPGELDELVRLLESRKVDSVAVSLLFSFEAPGQERAIRDVLAPLGVPVSLSSEILPEYREYERTSTTVVNAYLAPVMERYLGRLGAALRGRSLSVMQSNGGSAPAEVAMAAPVRTILSGPAGGVVGAFHVASHSGHSRVITFDMGGTSTDVALLDGEILTTHESAIDGLPIGVPMLEIHTVGAGGGSIAGLDTGGALRVGPESAGADPGPICYGSGRELTVTDANLLLGRLRPRFFLGGDMALDAERARARTEGLSWGRSWKSVWHLAAGVIDVVNSNMEQAIRLISVERGHDVRDFTLVCFGGAGALHAATLARSLGIPRVLVPPHPGALSALGLLLADARKDYSQSVLGLPAESPSAFRKVFARMHRTGLDALRGEGYSRGHIRVSDFLDVRYRGQSYELTVPYPGDWRGSFHRLHERRYGHADPAQPLEVVVARSRLLGTRRKPAMPSAPRKRVPARPLESVRVWADGKWTRAGVYDRAGLGYGDRIQGAAVIGEYSSTTFVPPGFSARVDRFGNLMLAPRKESR